MSIDLYEVRPRKDHRGVNLISHALPFGRLWYGEPNAASNATRTKQSSRSHDCHAFTGNRNVIECTSTRAIFKKRIGRFSPYNGFRFANPERFGTILAAQLFNRFPRR